MHEAKYRSHVPRTRKKISIDLCNISSMKKRTMSNILGRQTEPFSR